MTRLPTTPNLPPRPVSATLAELAIAGGIVLSVLILLTCASIIGRDLYRILKRAHVTFGNMEGTIHTASFFEYPR